LPGSTRQPIAPSESAGLLAIHFAGFRLRKRHDFGRLVSGDGAAVARRAGPA
jgi:hypothetical protein